MMKKLTGAFMVLLMAFSLSACSQKYSEGGSQMKVKCPACGYEFETKEAR